MKFTLPIRTFLHMVKVVTEPSGDLLEVYDHTLRISAVGKELTLSSNRTEAGCEAEIAEEGVCFFQHGRLKRLLLEYMRTITDPERLEIEITPEGVRVGQTQIDRAGWEVSLFRNPATAPQELRLSKAADPAPDPQMRMSF